MFGGPTQKRPAGGTRSAGRWGRGLLCKEMAPQPYDTTAGAFVKTLAGRIGGKPWG